MHSLLSLATKLIPERMKGQIMYHLTPNLGEEWGGPFNGQCYRQCIVAGILNAMAPAAIVETGTFRGTSTLFLAMNSRGRVFSTEVNPRNFGFVSRRLRHLKNLAIVRKDSRPFLKELKLASDLPIFFYLDAHWEEDLPLREEVEIIQERFSNFAIMIDDFQVPHDAGYKFDDYGPGKMLSLRDFPFQKDPRLSLYFPACPSSAETGLRRGCIVLASSAAAARILEIDSLREYHPAMHSRG